MTNEKETAEDSRRPKVVFYSFLILLFFVFFLAFIVFRHFLVTVAVSASVAALLGPVYDRLTHALRGRRSLSAALMVALTTVVILVPLLTYVILLSNQAIDFYEWVRPKLEADALRQLWSQGLPARYPWVLRVQEAFQLTELDQNRIMELVSPALSQLASGANRIIQGAVAGVTSALLYLILFLITLFFILRDGEALAGELKGVSPRVDGAIPRNI